MLANSIAQEISEEMIAASHKYPGARGTMLDHLATQCIGNPRTLRKQKSANFIELYIFWDVIKDLESGQEYCKSVQC